jgi:heme-degrading monooxygenase HmoA
MYARVVRYERVSEDEWEIGAGWFRDDYLPMAMETAGFDGAFLFRDREHEVTMSVTFWSDLETAVASAEAVQPHLDKWAEMTGRVPTIETYEVVVSTNGRGMPRPH